MPFDILGFRFWSNRGLCDKLQLSEKLKKELKVA